MDDASLGSLENLTASGFLHKIYRLCPGVFSPNRFVKVNSFSLL
jgi:hypothetical protein